MSLSSSGGLQITADDGKIFTAKKKHSNPSCDNRISNGIGGRF